MTQTPVIELSAMHSLRPRAGTVLEILEGEVLVFAVDSSGRRIPLANVPAGDVVIGCAPTSEGIEMLVTGVPGTKVRQRESPINVVAVQPFETWIRKLAEATAGDRWPTKLIAIASAGSMVAPGENIGSGRHETGLPWVQQVGGVATMCGLKSTTLTPDDPMFPLPGNAWLRAGLRCRIQEVMAPAGAEELLAAAATWGRLALQAVSERRNVSDIRTEERIEARELRADDADQEAVDVLVLAAGASEKPPRFSDRRQSERIAAAVRVARHAGLPVTDVGVLRAVEEVSSGRDAVDAVAGVCSARAREIRLQPGWLRTEGSPLIVQATVGDEHGAQTYALVWQRGWVLVDVEGEATPVTDEIAGQMERRAVELLGVLPSKPSTLGDLMRLGLKGSGREWVVVGLVTTLLTGLAFLTPFFFGQLANLFIGAQPTSAYVALFTLLLLIVLAGATWQAVRSLSLLRARSRSMAIATGSLWDRIMRLPARWHSGYPLGDRMAQSNAVSNASTAFPDETMVRLLDSAIIIGSLGAIATTNLVMLAALGGLMALQLIFVTFFLQQSSHRARERVAASAAATGLLIEMLKAVNRLRVSGAESRAFLRWARVQALFVRADQSLRKIGMLQGTVLAVWPVLAILVVVAVTAATGATFADFITAQTAAAAATVAIASLAVSGSAALVARQSLLKAVPVLEAVPEGGGAGIQPGVIQGGFEVRDLVFRYEPELPAALDQVSVSIKPGEHVAFVGPSGCGKTTLMRVILGLEDPESGVMLVDGRDMSALDRMAVRRQIGSVLQSALLLPATIKENVAMGRPLTQAQVWEALDQAGVGDDIRQLGMGLDTPVVDGGGTLSGGQRQRVLIARALAGNPRILVLDEATSALDNVTQAVIVQTLDSLQVTRVVVAHRLSTIRQADRIVVMDAGRITDQGTYDELMSRPGAFRDLAERQEA
jgi:ABC-type bacteriocin/lantibiotic exporter with double-glycine peptidase domain